jgi:hypothetical protein
MTHRSLRRFLGRLLFSAAAVVPANANADDDVDGQRLALRLQQAHPLDATRIAATDATAAAPEVRRAVADALAWVFPLVGDGLILEHLATDERPEVRLAVARAAHTRRAFAVLERLTHDPDPEVREAAILGLHGR